MAVPDKVHGGTMNIPLVVPAVPDPPNSVSGSLHVNRHIGAVSERQQRLIEEYCRQPCKQRLLQEYGINQSALEILLWVKAMRSNADPGEGECVIVFRHCFSSTQYLCPV